MEKRPSSGRDIVALTVEEQQEFVRRSGSELSRDELKSKFGKRIEERKQALAESGVNVDSLVSEIDVTAAEYENQLQDRIPAYIQIGSISETEGAAGLYRILSNRTLLDEGVLEFGMSQDKEGYWERVVDHEKVHSFQAKQFDANYVQKADRVIPLIALLEGEAVQKNQPEDLTPEYQEYDAIWHELEDLVGIEYLQKATREGKVKELQDEIDIEMAERNSGYQID